MKTPIRLAMALFLVFLFISAPIGRVQAEDLILDQKQEQSNYGYWFEKNLIRWQEFKPTRASLARIDLYIHKNGSPGNLKVALKNSAQDLLWEATVGGKTISGTEWVEIPVNPYLPVTPQQSYFIHVFSDADSPDPQNRYFWDGQTQSSYQRGISSVEGSRPGYDFGFRTWSNAEERGRTCYIYDSQPNSANRFKSLLDANGYRTTLIHISSAAGTDYSPYDLIIVGSDTGRHYEWGDPESVNAVQAAAKPILGLGYYGGSALFQEMGLAINWGNGAVPTGDSLYAVDLRHAIYHTPYPIDIPSDRTIRILKSPRRHIAEHSDYMPDQVALLGREPDLSKYFPLVQEEQYILWGFADDPANMTTAGKALFMNVVHHLTPALPYLYLSLHIEDALEGVPVNKIVGDTVGPTFYTRLEIVTKLLSYSANTKDDIPVVLSIPADLFGAPTDTWVRTGAGGYRSAVSHTDLGGGRYRVTTDLSPYYILPGIALYYHKEIVWRFLIPTGMSPQDVVVNAEVQIPCKDPLGSGTVKILAPGSVSSLIVTNRKLLYENHYDSSVTSLLQRLFAEAQGPPASHTPRGVVYYVERYDSLARNWDNATVDYTSETTANVVANRIDELIEDWWEDALEWRIIDIPGFGKIPLPYAYPTFLLIVGDDDIIPFYRYDDPSNDEGIDKIGWCPHGWCEDSATNPAIHATDEDFFFTDNPYADLAGGTDWQTGDIELFNGRLLGDSAADMLSLLEEGVDWNNGQTGGAVMASVDGWELGLEPDDGRAGEIADLHDVTALLRGRGFDVRNDDSPAAEVGTIDVMSPYEGGDNSWNTNFRNAANDAGGMDLFFIGGHDNYDHAVIPGDNFSPDDTPTRYTRFGIDHPVAMIVGCHGGVPVPDIDVDGGADHSMVYDLIREGARAYIGATGFSYGSPNDLHRCTWGERLMQRFFDNLMHPAGSNSMALGAALARAKRDYVFGFGNRDYLDRKTVTEFNLYGVPWSFLFYPDAGAAYAGDIAGSAGRTKEVGFSILTKPVVKAPEAATYTRTLEIRIDSYKVAKETQDNVQYHIISIPGGEVAVGPELPILPYIKGFELPLPTEAQVTAVNVVEASSQPIGKLNIPTADVLPWSQGGMKYTTETRVNYLYPPAKDLVQYQKTGDAVLFTVFPIQHNPSSGDTIFYKEFRVNVTYVAPLTIAITEFSTDKPIYLPGETIRTTTFIENIGDMDARLWAELLIKDAIGEIVGSSKSDDFTVPAGKARKIELAWEGVLADAGYTAQINLFSDKTPTGGASRSISVRGGGISEVLVPERLYAGETGIFEVWFANYRTKAVSGEVRLSIQDTAEGFVQELPPKSIQVGAQTEGAVSFLWTPVGLNGGPFSAKVDVEVNDMEYGPTSRSFVVIPTACQGDLDIDGDSDGRDLNLFMTAKPEIHLQDLADYFGRDDCRP